MLASIFNTFANCFKVPELKSRILCTMLVLAICRLAAYIMVPGLDGTTLKTYFEGVNATGSSALGLFDTFTGGAMERCAVGALGIMPYISATIVMQLLTAVVPSLSKMAREEGGRVKIIKYSRYLTVLICLGQGTLMALGWEHPKSIPGFGDFPHNTLVLYHNLWWYRFQTVLILTVATLLLMWLGEQITERGIGNGVSLVITIGILARLPQAERGLADMVHSGNLTLFHAIALVLLLAFVVGGGHAG